MTIANVYISYDRSKPENERFVSVDMWGEVSTLFDEVIPTLAKRIGGDFFDKAEADLMCEHISFTELSADEFKLAYDLTMNACDKETVLKPYKAKFEQAFKSDPRFA